ncbi:MAG: hypothetical protein WBX19_15485 [Terracidiphilus sp.]
MSSLFATAAILFASGTAFAQAVGGGVAGAIICGELPPAPVSFTASWKITTVRKRAQGHVITHISRIKAAMDSVGRAYNETHWLVPISGSPRTPGPFFVSVSDPQRQILIKWNSDSREAIIFHAPEQSQARPEMAKQLVAHEPDCQQMPTPPPPSETGVEQLGPKTIHGLEATGVRFTVILPAQPGSKEPAITVIRESWSSIDYGVEVLRIVTYPNGDYEKSELESYENGAPDPALFEIPEGYTARDVYRDASPPVSNR